MTLKLRKDMRLMTRDELAFHFAARDSKRIKLQPLMRAAILQVHGRIQAGDEDPIWGNIRTVWYRYIKPILSHMHDDDVLKSDPYKIMTRAFADLVKRGDVRYMDFGLVDENWENRRIGNRHPHIIVFSEKAGWVYFLRQTHEKHGVTTLALGGLPSALTSEYTAAHVLDAIGPDQDQRTVHLVGIVDWDPAGDVVARSFQQQLVRSGIKNTTLETVIHPKHYSDRDIDMFKFALPTRTPARNRDWMAKTGGVRGEEAGLEAESMPLRTVAHLVDIAIEQYIDHN